MHYIILQHLLSNTCHLPKLSFSQSLSLSHTLFSFLYPFSFSFTRLIFNPKKCFKIYLYILYFNISNISFKWFNLKMDFVQMIFVNLLYNIKTLRIKKEMNMAVTLYKHILTFIITHYYRLHLLKALRH